MSGQRISNLRNDLQTAAAWAKPSDSDIESRFKRVQAKLRGYVNDPERTLSLYPASDTSAAARYARAYAYHKSGYPQQAAAETTALVASNPDDPYFLELQGQILLESGKPDAALVALREATERTRSAPLIASTLGHALLATENSANLDEAERVLKQSVANDRQNPFAWVQLGTVYERKGDGPRAALATAERANLTRDVHVALVSAERAMAGLPQGSAEWIRAQDIQMVSKTAIEDEKRRR
jgi:predicted Zn-dependent protease